jgi:hypothetical protein
VNQSPFLAIKQLETQLKTVLRGIDPTDLDETERKAAANIKRLVIDVRLDIQDYELSETREEQLKKAAAARKGLAKLQANVLLAETVFGPADVAQLSALLGQIAERLE